MIDIARGRSNEATVDLAAMSLFATGLRTPRSLQDQIFELRGAVEDLRNRVHLHTLNGVAMAKLKTEVVEEVLAEVMRRGVGTAACVALREDVRVLREAHTTHDAYIRTMTNCIQEKSQAVIDSKMQELDAKFQELQNLLASSPNMASSTPLHNILPKDAAATMSTTEEDVPKPTAPKRRRGQRSVD